MGQDVVRKLWSEIVRIYDDHGIVGLALAPFWTLAAVYIVESMQKQLEQ